MKIAFLGLGPMGAPMALRLIDAGRELCVWNRSQDKIAPLAARGARVAATPKAAAEGAEMVITSVANDSAVRAVTFGPNGLADGLGRGAIHVSTSTISVALARELDAAHRERGQKFVSATVLGRPPAAAAGKLYIMAAGQTAALDMVKSVLQNLGQRIFEVGEQPWQSNLVKLCANFMIFSTIEQFAEVFALSEKAGIAPGTVFEVLSNSFCSAPVHLNYGKMILEGEFSPPGGAMQLGAKDNALILQAGEEFGASLPMASLLRDRFIASFARGEGELDFCALSNRARDDAGLAPKR
jgi:3-hydroxyisobutyrate dehydrogenase-like beta-hydroxyacid dehydrogenase